MRTALLTGVAVLALGMLGLGIPSAQAQTNVPIAASVGKGTNAAGSQGSNANAGTQGSYNSKTVDVTKDNGNTSNFGVTKDNGNTTTATLATALGLGDNVVGNGTLSNSIADTYTSTDVTTDLSFASAHAGGSLTGSITRAGSGVAENNVMGNIGVITANANSGVGQFNTSVAATGVDNGIQFGNK